MIENCYVCGSNDIEVEYDGIIRDGGLGKYTSNPVKMYRCNNCKVIWHKPIKDLKEYYTSDDYRMELEGTINENDFYALHDKESIDKLLYTGMIFRNKTVADIGCGCGAFLDLISGVASKIIAIEPTEKYRDVLVRKKYDTFCYAEDALIDYKDRVDVIVSFDVIEHVDEPLKFMTDIYSLLKKGGRAFIGTPTETPVMRKLLGECYEKKVLFSTQHLWIFGKSSLLKLAEAAGFDKDNSKVEYFQRYGLSNVFAWLKNKEPGSKIDADMITSVIDASWRHGLEEHKISDYIVLYLEK